MIDRLLVTAAAALLAVLMPGGAHAQGCVTSLTPNPLVVPASGAAATVTVQTSTPDCQWAVGSVPTWLNFPDQFGGTGPGTVRFSRASPNHDGTPRANPGSVVIGNLALPLSQPANPCPLTVSPSLVTALANGGGGSFIINTTGTGCSYAVGFGTSVTITSGQSGSTFPATVSFTVPPNTTSNPAIHSLLISSLGTFLFAPGVGILQNGPPIVTDATPGSLTMSVHRPASGPAHISQAELLQLTNAEDADAPWSMTVTHPWLKTSVASGTTPQTISLSIDPAEVAALPAGEYVATLSFVSPIAPSSRRPVDVSLRVTDMMSLTTAPGGFVDVPPQNATSLSGAVPVGGWAIDDVGIRRVQVYRSAFGSEPPGEIYLGDASRVRGARPDIVAAFRPRPELSRAGWGFMILSNMLPNGGNGTFVLSAVAEDIEGHRTLLGQRTATFDNTNSIFPFGTIDFPSQGGTMSGTYVNQGWALAQPGRFIPFDGSTLRLFIDGAQQPNAASYNTPRPDVAALFPAPPYANSGGPAVQFTIDTTQFANGVHTIAWTARDDAGVTQGIGSRFVDVQNGSGAITAGSGVPLDARSAAAVAAVPLATAFVWDRKGFDDGEWSLRFAGTRVNEIRARRGERIEIALDTWWWSQPCGAFAGYLRSGDVAGPLPPGASIDGEQGVFRWLPPAEFAGTFEFAFLRPVCSGRQGGPGQKEERIPVTVIIADR
jgi:hypothetical protein